MFPLPYSMQPGRSYSSALLSKEISVKSGPNLEDSELDQASNEGLAGG